MNNIKPINDEEGRFFINIPLDDSDIDSLKRLGYLEKGKWRYPAIATFTILDRTMKFQFVGKDFEPKEDK